MTQLAKTSDVAALPYAVASDFCRIFAEEIDRLYQLSYVLTADHAKAEQCIFSALEDCTRANRVFKEWAASWARRAIIQNAIHLIQPVFRQTGPVQVTAVAEMTAKGSGLLAGLFGLKTFERFVFVMSVLEHYTDQDCKTLLGCSRRDIVRARAQAFVRLASSSPKVGGDVATGALFAPMGLLSQPA
jgi:hypothetical protein